jgi:hypothetical protein
MKPRKTLSDEARRRREFVLGENAVKEEREGRNNQPQPQPAVSSPDAPPEPEEEPTVNQAYRLPKSLVNRLRRAVFERKNAGVKPASANAIAEEALTRWLDEEEKRARTHG